MREEGTPIYTSARSRRLLGRPARGRTPRFLLALLVVALVTGIGVLVASAGGDSEAPSGQVVIVRGEETVLEASAERLRSATPAELKKRLAPLLGTRTERRARTRIVLKTDRRKLVGRVRAAADDGEGRVVIPERPVSASTRLPIVRQALRNNCETAALSMLLAGEGFAGDQLALQRQLKKSRPLDPRQDARGEMVWGDPDRGFVGRADGGGPAGGYGVYEGPIRALAASGGVRLEDVGGGRPERIYRQLLAGRPVLVWIGLSEGPYETWRSPEGRQVRGNFGEHTVVLTGLRKGRLEVNDPLDGRRKTWSREQFEELWPRLGRRALSL